MAERIIKRVDKAALTVPLLPQPIKRHKRVAAYARVSTASDEQMNSVEAQKDYFEKMILQHENWVLAGIYADATDIIGLKQNPTNGRRFSPIFFVYRAFST